MVRNLLCALTVLSASLEARAATITFETLPGVIEHDSYNGFVGASVDGEFYNLVCNDYDHFTDAPSGPWEFNVSTIPSLTFVRFGGSPADRLALYQQAALLLAGDGNTLAGLANVSTSHDITGYQYAFWKLFGADVDDVDGAGALLLAAHDDLSNGTDYSTTYGRLLVFTPTGSAIDNQEFLGLDQHWNTSETPEPGSAILLGGGLLALAGLFGKRLRPRC